MIDTLKHAEFFNGSQCDTPCHVIGLGAIGSHVAEQLVRLGVPNIFLYDFDTVEPANVANQLYFELQVGMPKTQALCDNLNSINEDQTFVIHEKGWTGQPLNGYIFLCLDNIDLRRQIVEANLANPEIKAMFDFRMRLTDAQHYAAAWTNKKQKAAFLSSMQFTHAEAKESTPVSACGTTLSVLPTIRVITALGISQFINFNNKGTVHNAVLIDAFSFDIITLG